MQRSVGNEPLVGEAHTGHRKRLARTPQTAKEENGPDFSCFGIPAVFPFGIPTDTFGEGAVWESLDPSLSFSLSAPAIPPNS